MTDTTWVPPLAGHDPIYMPEAGGVIGCSCGRADDDYREHAAALMAPPAVPLVVDEMLHRIETDRRTLDEHETAIGRTLTELDRLHAGRRRLAERIEQHTLALRSLGAQP